MLDNDVETALLQLEKIEGWPASSLWIAPDASANLAIWRERSTTDLLHCVGHVQSEQFAELVAFAMIARISANLGSH
ncbi:MAG: hypothetical protein H7293_09550 [Candidatus Saccharibacteria bacterium]|nr:hypothetical protein [Rhodoferax sp.]